MEQIKSLLPYVPGAVVALVEAGLQVSGITNLTLAIALWGLAALLLFWGAWYSLKGRWRLQWPLVRKVTPLPPGTVSTAPRIAHNLYVGEINFDLGRLKDDRYITIAIRVFNGTGSIVSISGLNGSISFGAIGVQPSVEQKSLPSPTIRNDTETTVQPSREWFIILIQTVPGLLADHIFSLLSDNVRVIFDLDTLDILVSRTGHQEDSERLLLWNGLTLAQGICHGRQVKLHARDLVVGRES